MGDGYGDGDRNKTSRDEVEIGKGLDGDEDNAVGTGLEWERAVTREAPDLTG